MVEKQHKGGKRRDEIVHHGARPDLTSRKSFVKYIVNEDYRFVYFVVQRVACTSLKTALLPLFRFDAMEQELSRRRGIEDLNVHVLLDKSSTRSTGNSYSER